MPVNKLFNWTFALFFSFTAGSAFALSTTIEIVNNTSSNASLTSPRAC